MSFPPVTKIINTPLEPVPVTIIVGGTPAFDGPYIRNGFNGVLVTQAEIANDPNPILCQGVAGYVADANPANLYFVQLHDLGVPVSPGDIPKVVIPVYGGYSTFSYAIETEFNNGGWQIALSTTQLTFTAPASDMLAWYANGRLVS
jgi:hypothetical protein